MNDEQRGEDFVSVHDPRFVVFLDYQVSIIQ